jgi:hypothetical protein
MLGFASDRKTTRRVPFLADVDQIIALRAELAALVHGVQYSSVALRSPWPTTSSKARIRMRSCHIA